MYKYKKVLLLVFFLVVFSIAFVGGWFFQREAQSRYSRSGRSVEYQTRCPVGDRGKSVVNCYVQIAVEENDYSVCNYLNDARLHGWVADCYLQLAITLRDEKSCDFIEDESLKDECYLKVSGV